MFFKHGYIYLKLSSNQCNGRPASLNKWDVLLKMLRQFQTERKPNYQNISRVQERRILVSGKYIALAMDKTWIAIYEPLIHVTVFGQITLFKPLFILYTCNSCIDLTSQKSV